MFEGRHQQLISRRHFVQRMTACMGLSVLVVAAALGIGVLGYRQFAGLEWIDALHNAAMILGGMGPVAEMKSDAAKLFSSAYALFSGLVFVGIVALTLAPVFHRVLHHFHVDESDLKS
jgi:FtsH-binding integral membrane protein